MEDKLLTLEETRILLGVCKDTLRDWDNKGKLKSVKTEGGHRRYKQSDVDAIIGTKREVQTQNKEKVAVYCRVSSHEQKEKGDLDRQKARLLEHCIEKKYDVGYIFDEVGSGMNDNRSKLIKLMDLAKNKEITKVIIEHKDRLTRFNKNILIKYFESHNVIVEWTCETLSKGYENELVEDMLSLITSFSSKIYGRRSAENRKKKESKNE